MAKKIMKKNSLYVIMLITLCGVRYMGGSRNALKSPPYMPFHKEKNRKEYQMEKIKLTRNQFTIVDDDDYYRVNQFKWRANYSSSVKKYYAIKELYICTCHSKRYRMNIHLHKYIMNCPDNMQVDHINGDTLDNRKSNLRICTHQQNNWNKKPANVKKTSKFIGVCWCKNNKTWRANIKINNRQTHLGYFKTEIDAAKQYNKIAKKIRGEFV